MITAQARVEELPFTRQTSEWDWIIPIISPSGGV